LVLVTVPARDFGFQGRPPIAPWSSAPKKRVRRKKN